MKIFKDLFFLLIAFVVAFSAIANKTLSKYDALLYESYKSGNMEVWAGVIESLQKDYGINNDNATLLSLIQAQYGYIGYLIGIKESKKARQYLTQAEENADNLIVIQPNNADALALRAALMAYQIALSPYKAPFIGPKSMTAINHSLEVNPNSAQALLEKANSAHYAPSMFGGNPVEAVKYYTKCIAAMEQQNGGSEPKIWIYLNAYAQLALAQEKAKQIPNAKRTYLYILKIAPDFKWVANELYPQFKERHNL
ncbi:MAG: hypothetical protein PHD06_00225 [Bacteroidales bacterium]|jgi:tetratricopeptide (TPR) repeat protein|nr:hypothetical protein [Bacteroidales bacterium]MDD4383583.1 hypothetical protein [Bacteroidales bacterium]MDY0197326.1 hypothetical protein [Tenuifilaceae bacterium]